MKMCKNLLMAAVCWQSCAAQITFPVIPRAVQQERDADRRLILEAELQEEKAALADARARYAKAPGKAEQDSVHRHEENIKALRRELGRPAMPPEPRKASAIATNHRAATMRQAAQLARRAPVALSSSRENAPSRSGTSSGGWVIFATPVLGSQPAQAVPSNATEPARTTPLPLSAPVPQPATPDSPQSDTEQSEPAFVHLVR